MRPVTSLVGPAVCALVYHRLSVWADLAFFPPPHMTRWSNWKKNHYNWTCLLLRELSSPSKLPKGLTSAWIWAHIWNGNGIRSSDFQLSIWNPKLGLRHRSFSSRCSFSDPIMWNLFLPLCLTEKVSWYCVLVSNSSVNLIQTFFLCLGPHATENNCQFCRTLKVVIYVLFPPDHNILKSASASSTSVAWMADLAWFTGRFSCLSWRLCPFWYSRVTSKEYGAEKHPVSLRQWPLTAAFLCCSLAGVSRSTTMVVAYLMTVTRYSWEECLSAVKAVRSFVGPNYGFQQQLQEYQTAQVSEVRTRWKTQS